MPRLTERTPSCKAGVTAEKELLYRRLAANLLQDMGQRLRLHQVAINTGIVLMHRFYMLHSVSRFHRNKIALVSLFMASKMEETPRSLEDVICASHMCLVKDQNKAGLLDRNSELFAKIAKELTIIENIMTQTLGKDVAVDFPHPHVLKVCQLMKANKELVRTAYFLATNTLHLTTFCLEFRPTLVACMCIQLACRWDNWTIPRSMEGKAWFKFVDESVTEVEINGLMKEFLDILKEVPSKLRFKVSENASPSSVNNGRWANERRGAIAGPSGSNNGPTLCHGAGAQPPERGAHNLAGRAGLSVACPPGQIERGGPSDAKRPRTSVPTSPPPPPQQQQHHPLQLPEAGPSKGGRLLRPGMMMRPPSNLPTSYQHALQPPSGSEQSIYAGRQRPVQGQLQQSRPPSVLTSGGSAVTPNLRAFGTVPRSAPSSPSGSHDPHMRQFQQPSGNPASITSAGTRSYESRNKPAGVSDGSKNSPLSALEERERATIRTSFRMSSSSPDESVCHKSKKKKRKDRKKERKERRKKKKKNKDKDEEKDMEVRSIPSTLSSPSIDGDDVDEKDVSKREDGETK